jgi:hypothetical protein
MEETLMIWEAYPLVFFAPALSRGKNAAETNCLSAAISLQSQPAHVVGDGIGLIDVRPFAILGLPKLGLERLGVFLVEILVALTRTLSSDTGVIDSVCQC